MLCNHLHLPFLFCGFGLALAHVFPWGQINNTYQVSIQPLLLNFAVCVLPVCHLRLVINYASKDASETLYLCQCSLLVLKSGADAHGREASTPSIMSSK